MTYDHATSQIRIGGRPLVLHRRKFALLETLVRHVNQVAPRKTVMHHVYGIDEAVLPERWIRSSRACANDSTKPELASRYIPSAGEAIFSPRPCCDGATIVVVPAVDSAVMRSDHRNTDIGRRLLFQLCSRRSDQSGKKRACMAFISRRSLSSSHWFARKTDPCVCNPPRSCGHIWSERPGFDMAPLTLTAGRPCRARSPELASSLKFKGGISPHPFGF